MPQSHDITYFAKTNFRGQEAIFGIKTDDRRRHMYIIGKTGMGKTNLLEHLVLQDIQNGHGVAYVDPHGDTAEKLIRMIPPDRIKDVIYFNPADQAFPIAFNVMEQVAPEYRHLVASGLIGVFKKLWAESWGPRLEYILRNAILALLEYPGSTLLGVMRILVDKKYRAQVVNCVTDPVVKSFWVDEFSKWNDRVLQEVISPIQNKVGQFLSTSLIRNIVGQTKSSFNIREAMDNRKILILNLAKGRIGEDNSALLGAMMITKIQMAAMARVDIPENVRNDFYLYVDEFQNFATESFANILSEARKYRLNLILANQYVTQIDEIVRDAIFGNAGTLIAFRVGAMDAEFLEKEFEPVFMMNDVVNLPKYHIYLKLMIDGIAGDAFSATTLPPIETENVQDVSEDVIGSSRESYSYSKEDVEEGIREWSGVFAPPVQTVQEPSREASLADHKNPLSPRRREVASVERISSSIAQPRKLVKKDVPGGTKNVVASTSVSLPKEEVKKEGRTSERVLYDAFCDTCGLKIQLPFVPDGRRPTFCKECLKEYQRTMAKTQVASGSSVVKTTVENVVIAKSSREETVKLEQNVEPVAYITRDEPMRLSQMHHVAPKRFKPLRKRSEPDINAVKTLLQKASREESDS